MRASRKAYGSNSFFQSYIKVLHHQQDFCVRSKNYKFLSYEVIEAPTVALKQAENFQYAIANINSSYQKLLLLPH